MKTGYTTGVFDLFHVGHLNIIKRAKENCDHLIVGVSTDELVQEYKKRRPIIRFEERIEIVRSIKYVDEVIAQESIDKFSVWEKYHFDILFHGDDWKSTDLYNEIEAKLKKKGVEIVYFPRTEGVSTTDIKKYIYENYYDIL